MVTYVGKVGYIYVVNLHPYRYSLHINGVFCNPLSHIYTFRQGYMSVHNTQRATINRLCI